MHKHNSKPSQRNAGEAEAGHDSRPEQLSRRSSTSTGKLGDLLRRTARRPDWGTTGRAQNDGTFELPPIANATKQ
eukprot:831211-Pyramimonas_sp.AAC.1